MVCRLRRQETDEAHQTVKVWQLLSYKHLQVTSAKVTSTFLSQKKSTCTSPGWLERQSMAKYHVSRISQVSTQSTVKPKKDNRHQTRTLSVVSVSGVTSPVVTNTTGEETPRTSSAACDADMFCLSGTGDLSGWQHWQNGWASRRVTTGCDVSDCRLAIDDAHGLQCVPRSMQLESGNFSCSVLSPPEPQAD